MCECMAVARAMHGLFVTSCRERMINTSILILITDGLYNTTHQRSVNTNNLQLHARQHELRHQMLGFCSVVDHFPVVTVWPKSWLSQSVS